jgi:hypothetical protein
MNSSDREANGYFEASLLVAALAGLGTLTIGAGGRAALVGARSDRDSRRCFTLTDQPYRAIVRASVITSCYRVLSTRKRR